MVLSNTTDPPFTGTRWKKVGIAPGVIELMCLGEVPGPGFHGFLDGRTQDRTVGLAPTTSPPFSGTRWRVLQPSMVIGNTSPENDDVLAVHAALLPTAEIVYYWAAAGSPLAMLTPDLQWSFPRWEFVVFFGLHGLVLAAALLLVFGLGLHPRPGAPLRVLGITAGWTVFVALVNLVLGTNFMYLRARPGVASPLDWMGPWPLYIATAALVALAQFELLSLPFRREWRAGQPSAR